LLRNRRGIIKKKYPIILVYAKVSLGLPGGKTCCTRKKKVNRFYDRSLKELRRSGN